jgi:hypothetical protein
MGTGGFNFERLPSFGANGYELVDVHDLMICGSAAG